MMASVKCSQMVIQLGLKSMGKRMFNSGRVLRNQKLTAINPEELNHFNFLAQSWWDVHGPQRILHKMNLLRMDFIQQTIRDNIKINQGVEDPEQLVYIPPYDPGLLPNEISRLIVQEQKNQIQNLYSDLELEALDIGCGGGILTESLARLNIVKKIKGIDLSTEVIEIANRHKKLDPITDSKIEYKLQALEDIPLKEMYDVVTIFEMLEHVDYPSEVLKEALKHVKPGGWIFLSTINRDFVSWFTTIFMGEHVLKIVPVGTHNLEKYIKHSEIAEWLKEHKESFELKSSKGCVYLPAKGWVFTSNPDCGNYFMAIQRTN